MPEENKASAWLIAMRSTKHLSQRKLALRSGITNTAISDAERGYASAETWARLAEYFEWSTDVVLWFAGVLSRLAPPKDEIISRIERDLNRMSDEGREAALQLIDSITKDS